MASETRPIHEQLIRLCQEELEAGRWQPGQQFPSSVICARHGVSRATANKVLSKLASEGWLEMRKGIGCFVAERPTLFTSLRRIESFTVCLPPSRGIDRPPGWSSWRRAILPPIMSLPLWACLRAGG